MATYRSSVVIKGIEVDRAEIHKRYITGLALVNQVFLRKFYVPRIYDAPIRYIDEEPDGENPFLNCLAVIQNGGADCKSLTAWRLAELWEDGIKAECEVIDYGDGHCHVLIKHPNGFLEDISAAKGMPT